MRGLHNSSVINDKEIFWSREMGW